MLNKTIAKYPLTRVEVKTFMIHAGVVGKSIDNAILGQLPKRIIVGFIDNKAFNDNRKLNPFNSKNHGINFFSLYADGIQIRRYSQIFRKMSHSTLKLITHYFREPAFTF